MNPISAIFNGFLRILDFESRSSRSEFWWFILFLFIIYTVLSSNFATIPFFYKAPLILLAVSATTRRLHDRNLSGWWQLLLFTVIGILVILVACALPGTDGANDYGRPPEN